MGKIESRYDDIVSWIEKVRLIEWLMLAFSVIMVVVNVIRCNNYAFIPDECYTVKLSTWTWKEIIEETASDYHPPLYHLMTTFIYRLFGWGAPLYRLFSVLPYGIELIVLNTYVKKRIGVLPSFLAMLFMSIAPASIYYTVSATYYEWASLFVFVFYLAVFEIMCGNNKSSSWVFLTFFALGAAYMHYYAFMDIALIYLGLLLYSLFGNKKLLKGVLISIVADVVGYFPWVVVSIQSFGRTVNLSDESWLKKMWMTMSDCWRAWFGWDAISIIAIALFSISVMKYAFVVTKNKESDAKETWIIIGVVSATLAIVVPKIIMIFAGNILTVRYLYPMLPVAIIALGSIISNFRFKYIYTIGLGVFVSILGTGSLIASYETELMDNAKNNDFLNSIVLDESDFVVGDQLAFTWTVLGYYYPQVMNCGLEDWLNDYDPETSSIKPEQHWLFCYLGMQDYILEALEEKGLRAEYIYTGQLGTMDEIEVYKIDYAND